MSDSSERYAFGPFVLDASERLLLRDRAPIQLSDKVFDTLVILVRNGGRLVTKEELFDAIWPETHIEESNLNQNISALRRVFGDFDCIQTVPKHGFRFSTPVTVLAEKRPDESQFRKRVTQLAVFATLVAAAIALPIGSDHARSEVASPRGVTVLPFRLLGVPPDKSWVAASLSETLANRLGAIPGLQIRPAGMAKDADAVITGAVQPGGGAKLRITAELLDTRRNVTVWSGSFDCTAADLLPIEDSLSDSIGERLRPGLTPEERAGLTPPHSSDAAANDEYLRGRELLDRRASFEQSTQHFERALARDPKFALAWAGLAEALMHPSPHTSRLVIARASDAARRAVHLDPALAEAHGALGFIQLFYEWNWIAAERELRVALQLKPGGARMHDWYAFALLTRGDMTGAVREVTRAHEIDPQSADIAEDVALIEYESRDYKTAERAARVAISLAPKGAARAYLVDSLMIQQRTGEALAELDAADNRSKMIVWDAALLRSNDRKAFAKQLRQSEPELASETPDAIAALYLAAGEKEKALEWLERAYRDHAFGLLFIGQAPELDALRDDPRFHDLVRRVGVVEVRSADSKSSLSAASTPSSMSVAR
jgi:DNA-binding winged helix-turn-helix (wHTH) protein/tetratricopeptide (TPR) repeat protein/TolB-like protein